jgi:hypothetical protein
VTVPVSCNPVAGTPCAGRVTVESPGWRTATLINGRAPRRLVPPTSRELALAPGLHTSFGRRVDRRRVRRLRVTIVEPDAETAVVAPVVRVR